MSPVWPNTRGPSGPKGGKSASWDPLSGQTRTQAGPWLRSSRLLLLVVVVAGVSQGEMDPPVEAGPGGGGGPGLSEDPKEEPIQFNSIQFYLYSVYYTTNCL